MRPMMKGVLVAGVAVTVLAGAALVALLTGDAESGFRERRGELVAVREEPAGGDSLFRRSWVSLRSASGLTVECGVLAPRPGGGRYPAVVLLGGKATGKHAVDYALDIRDVIIVAVDYPYEPPAEYTAPRFLADVPAIRRALLDMPPSVMLVFDYCARRPDVDPSAMVLLGYSFGAPLVPVVAAMDRRPALAAMVYGGGDLRSLIRHNVRRSEGVVAAEVASLLGALLLRPLEPLRYAGRIAPTPALMINGTDDEQIPRKNALLLYDALREPRKLVWIDSRHVHPRDTALTRRIIGVLGDELAARGLSGRR